MTQAEFIERLTAKLQGHNVPAGDAAAVIRQFSTGRYSVLTTAMQREAEATVDNWLRHGLIGKQ